MPRLLALTLVLFTGALGVPGGVFAQAPSPRQVATISGQAADAGGRALSNQRMELLQAADIVASTTTGSRGEWSFTNVVAGDYVVRMNVNGQVAGIRVSVTPGQSVTHALIVAPSAAAPSASFLGMGGMGVVGGTLITAAVVAAIITTIVVVTGS